MSIQEHGEGTGLKLTGDELTIIIYAMQEARWNAAEWSQVGPLLQKLGQQHSRLQHGQKPAPEQSPGQ